MYVFLSAGLSGCMNVSNICTHRCAQAQVSADTYRHTAYTIAYRRLCTHAWHTCKHSYMRAYVHRHMTRTYLHTCRHTCAESEDLGFCQHSRRDGFASSCCLCQGTRAFDFVYLPWPKLAIINFVSQEQCVVAHCILSRMVSSESSGLRYVKPAVFQGPLGSHLH